jgi:hypothetical protein
VKSNPQSTNSCGAVTSTDSCAPAYLQAWSLVALNVHSRCPQVSHIVETHVGVTCSTAVQGGKRQPHTSVH